MIHITDQCRNRWASILNMFGIDQACLKNVHGPCPICGGKDRFRFDDKDGNGTYFCSQCRAGDGMKLLMLKTGMTFKEAAEAIRERLGETRESSPARTLDPAIARQRAGGLWAKGVPIFQDEAATYFASRGITGPFPTSLRFCTSARVTDHPRRQTLGAILALVQDPAGNPVNVHRTFLENGAKANIPAPRKMMRGEVPEGSAIRLGSYDGVLGVAEGLETALKVRQRFGIPCWSTIDAEKLAKFAIPGDVRELHIFGDHDLSFTGQWATYALAKRAKNMRAGPERVHVRIPGLSLDPALAGLDWADDIPETARAA